MAGGIVGAHSTGSVMFGDVLNESIAAAFIAALPQLIIVLVGSGLLVAYRQPVAQLIERRATSLTALGLISITLRPEDVDAAVIEKDGPLPGPIRTASGLAGSQVARRWDRLAPHMAGRTILWVDDNLSANRIERRLLRQMRLFVEPALTNDAAMLVMAEPNETISLVISDIKRGIGPTGIDLLQSIQLLPHRPPVIFYVSHIDANRAAPPTSFGITNRPDELLNLVMDALERSATVSREGQESG
jgi:CheY-like chemotaxis protein